MQVSVRSCCLVLAASFLAGATLSAQAPDPQLAQNLKRLSIHELRQLVDIVADMLTPSRG